MDVASKTLKKLKIMKKNVLFLTMTLAFLGLIGGLQAQEPQFE